MYERSCYHIHIPTIYLCSSYSFLYTERKDRQSTKPSRVAKPPRQSTSKIKVKKTIKSRTIHDKVKKSTSIEESFHHMLKEGIEEVDPSLSKLMIETIEHKLGKDDACPRLNKLLTNVVTDMKKHLRIPNDTNGSSDAAAVEDDEDNTATTVDDDNDDDDNAAANVDDNVEVDLVYYHPEQQLGRISDQYILIFGDGVPQLANTFISRLPGYNRLKQVCLEHQSEAKSLKVKPGKARNTGDHAMDVPIKVS